MRYNIDKPSALRSQGLKYGRKASKSALKSSKKHAKSRFFDAFTSLCRHICRSEIYLKTSIGGVILAKRRIDDNETPFQSQRNAGSFSASDYLKKSAHPYKPVFDSVVRI